MEQGEVVINRHTLIDAVPLNTLTCTTIPYLSHLDRQYYAGRHTFHTLMIPLSFNQYYYYYYYYYYYF